MLVALAASLFALIATAHAEILCGYDTIGVPLNNFDMMKQLDPVLMEDGNQDVTIDIPENVCARVRPRSHVGGVLGGVFMRACDFAAAPVVHLKTLWQAVVSRASYRDPGVVHITVQCVPSGMAS